MAVSVTTNNRQDDVWGRRRVHVLTVTFDDAYPTGGEAFDPNRYGVEGTPAVVICEPRPTGAGLGLEVQYDKTNEKLIASTGGAQVANDTDLSAVVVDVVIIEA